MPNILDWQPMETAVQREGDEATEIIKYADRIAFAARSKDGFARVGGKSTSGCLCLSWGQSVTGVTSRPLNDNCEGGF